MRPATLRMGGAASASIHEVLAGPRQPADWLGVCGSALYLLTRSGTVLAVLTHDAVRLPCAVVLPRTSAELPLTAIARVTAHPAAATVGAGRVRWVGPAGVITVECTRQWRAPRVPTGAPRPAVLAHLRSAVAGVDVGVEAARVAALAHAGDVAAQASAAAGLLGRGPGLTPSGDDVLAGFLIGARAFGRPADGVLQTIAGTASIATTALSAQLLRCAARGECVPELADVVTGVVRGAVSPSALDRLRAVGHTSGAALAHGLLLSAQHPVHVTTTELWR